MDAHVAAEMDDDLLERMPSESEGGVDVLILDQPLPQIGQQRLALLGADRVVAADRAGDGAGRPSCPGASAAVSPGGTIRNMKVETLSPGLNGPGTWLWTGPMLWRKAAIAMASSAVSCAKACHGMIGVSMRPSGRRPPCIAVTICAWVQLPMPVSLSGVILRATKTAVAGISKPTSEPPRKRDMSGLPKKYPGVWQSLQPLIVTRYLPRAIWGSSARAVTAGSAAADMIRNAR